MSLPQQLSFRQALAPPPSTAPLRRRDVLADLLAPRASGLAGDLDFAGEDTGRASHSFHPFAAKFPPALPRLFIERLTVPGEVVLDPLMGSGTTPVEALSLGRQALGSDLDPLALRLARAKTTPIHPEALHWATENIVPRAEARLADRDALRAGLAERFPAPERAFLDYWFLPETQEELLGLRLAIEEVRNADLRRFLDVAFSAIIIAKSGGVTLARDLAHSRPHKVAKTIRPALPEFEKRLHRNLAGLAELTIGATLGTQRAHADLRAADARTLPQDDASVDLIVTSPPYANAIDYMRAHKFSLIWLGRSLEELRELRAAYLGSERRGEADAELPPLCERVIADVSARRLPSANTLRKYLAQMGDVLAEMARVLRPDRAAVVVVGPSTMRGVPVPTHECLAELAERVAGLEAVGCAERRIDRNRRMMPARHALSGDATGIEARMHREFVLGFLKPPV